MRRDLTWAAGAVAALLLFSGAARAQTPVIVMCKNSTTGVEQQCNGSTDAGLPTSGGGGGGGNVNLTGINGVTPLAGAGATGTGSLRTTQGQDTTTIAGSAPGTAGTPSANVVSTQGVSGGVAMPVTGSGTAGSAAAGVMTVQGIASGTPVQDNQTQARIRRQSPARHLASRARPAPTWSPYRAPGPGRHSQSAATSTWPPRPL